MTKMNYFEIAKHLVKKHFPTFKVLCPNCMKEHLVNVLSPQMTCVCNYVFDPRKEK